ncbi:MAG: deoxyribose-phosphate aldolase [Phycisphaerales bacterium]
MPGVDAVMAARRAESFAKRSIKSASKKQALRLAMSMLDLTTLEGKDTPEKVRGLCRKAMHPVDLPPGRAPLEPPVPPCAAICVYPMLVPVAREALAGSGVRVAAVATGFPSGQYPLEVRLRDCAQAIAAGADEIDMVISRGLFLSGRDAEIAQEIRETRALCAAPPAGRPAHLKIILETGELETLYNVRRASDLAIAAACSVPGVPAPTDGEVFIKTSTGKVQPAATMPVTLVMLEAIRDHFLRTGVRIGMKPAGGIRTAKQAIAYLVMVKETLGDAWLTPHLFRFGASALANDIARQILRMECGGYQAGYDTSEA